MGRTANSYRGSLGFAELAFPAMQRRGGAGSTARSNHESTIQLQLLTRLALRTMVDTPYVP